ncbi:laccase domain-containing protein [Rubritalea marina]|uniref:laccase domain-containing protein n=1 Tax=Rubritalea marina TaxID=361055 RepID=UPI00036BEA73|nr:laccase domain-containing protein [Rubritalea marina]
MKAEYIEKLRELGFAADFVARVPGLAFDTDRERAVQALLPSHQTAIRALGFEVSAMCTAEQVHGAGVAIVRHDGPRHFDGVDGLITNCPNLALSIYVADCGAVYIVDPVQGAMGLVHSGKKGSELGILEVAVRMMAEEFGSNPADMVVSLAPCIRPPAYEIDFAAQIRASAESIGVKCFIDSGVCTSSDLSQYYSYRVEQGATGRMLAILGKIKDA